MPLEIFINHIDRPGLVNNFISRTLATTGIFEVSRMNAFLEKNYAIIKDQGEWFWTRQLGAAKYINLLVLALWLEQNVNNRNFDTLNEYL